MPDTPTDAFQVVQQLDPDGLVTKFVVIAEVIKPDGERHFWRQVPEGQPTWDTIGLLQYALELEREDGE